VYVYFLVSHTKNNRILTSKADSINPLPDGTNNSWFAQGINPTTTTLRYANTNEVCAVNYSSMASARIVTLARSLKATAQSKFVAYISILDDNKLEEFCEQDHKYVNDRPRVWECVASFRNDMFDVESI